MRGAGRACQAPGIRIHSGARTRYDAGRRRGTVKVTSFDIAEQAGVSQPTVSRALRGDPTVNAATRLRIETIARQLGYKVDRAASSLRRGEAKTLALLFFADPLPDGGQINPFFLSMLGSILKTCALRGYDLLTSFQQSSADWHSDYADSRKADGLILLGYGDWKTYRARLEQLVGQRTRFVRYGSVEPDTPGTVIGCDNHAGGAAVARHLLARGCRRIAFVGDASDHYPECRDRYRGLCAVLRAAGVAVDAALHVDAVSSEQSGHDAVRALIARGVPFDALFAASDLIALGALRALDEAGRRVPDDVALVGFDDIPAARLSRPPLTTVAQDYDRAGAVLVDTLVRRIAGETAESVMLPARLVARASS